MFQHNIHVLHHGLVLPCVSQGGWEWNLREMENIRGGCETQRAAPTVYTLRKRSLWPNKAAFWWVEMNALPHTSNPKLTEPTSQPSNQVPTLPVVTVLKLSTDFFSSPAQETVVWSCSLKIVQTDFCSDFPSSNLSNQILEHSGSPSLSLFFCSAWMTFVNHAQVSETIMLKGII